MIIKSQFRPLWWLKNPHLQTLWPVITQRRTPHQGREERVTLSDGDFLDLIWFDNAGPLVMVLHGLEGSIHSPYAAAITKTLQQQGYQVCFMHFRGCSGEPNLLDRSYHSGETSDFCEVKAHAEQQTGKPVYAAIGYSLGGNVLLKWLGEQQEQANIKKAVAISVPYQLADAARRMGTGLSRLYQQHLVSRLQQSYKRKFTDKPSPLDININELNSFFTFDDQVTAKLHGFNGVDDYYRLSSSRQYVMDINVPTLLIHSSDDPFMFASTAPGEQELSSSVTLEISEHGGHVGFIGGRIKPRRWLEGRILEFLRDNS